jgi:polyhydroxyalkanoate synthase
MPTKTSSSHRRGGARTNADQPATDAPADAVASGAHAGFDPVDPPVLGANPFVGLTRQQVAAALGRLLQRMVVEPAVVIADTWDVGQQLLRVIVGRSDVAPTPGDKRFAYPTWTSNPVYRRLLQAYLVEARSVVGLVDDLDLDHKSRERARFALSLFTEAAAPTNTLPGNPAALAKAMQTRGRSLLAGARHFAQDMRHNRGMPSTVDPRPFSVGGNLGVTPGQVVHRSDVFELIQYSPSTTTTYGRPLVAIPPQINKFYITDLAPERSLVEHTVAAGVPYFAVSWRNPTPEQRDWDLDTYVAACKEAVQVACDICATTDANTLGICAGGITMACLLGHLAATGEDLVHSATFMVAGLDTAVESTVGMLASRAAVEAARARSQRDGVLDGRDMAAVFAWLRPNDLVWNYWVNNYLLGENPPAFDILYWNADTTRLPAGLHSDFLDLSGSNGLAEPGTLTILDTPVDLGRVSCDTYVVGGSTDHIIPWTAAYRTTQLVAGSSEFVLSSSGHIQAIVNPPSNIRSSYMTRPGPPPPTADEWLAGATRQQGSWWNHWTSWLTSRSGAQRPAPTELGNEEHRPLEPAPGRYVHVQ